jgi:hypothetical protein
MKHTQLPINYIPELPDCAYEFLRRLWERLWSQIEVADSADPCWIWKGKTGKNGYGLIGGLGGNTAVYRLTWSMFNPDQESGNGMNIRHLCNNPLCCNPRHLKLGTVKENAHDRIANGTQTRGSQSPGARLTEEQVYDILCAHAEGEPSTLISEKYGVYYGTIDLILQRKHWTHVPLPPNWIGFRTARQLKKDRRPYGTRQPNAKVTEAQVYQLRVRFMQGELPSELAAEHGIAIGTACVMLNGRGWAHVPFPPDWDGYKTIQRRNFLADRKRKTIARKITKQS